MDEQLPGIGASKRIEITEQDLMTKSTPAPARPQAPTARPDAPSVPKATATAPAPTAAPPALPKTALPKSAQLGTYCGGCGNPIHEQAVVCPRCGVPTSSAMQATSAAMTVAMNAKSPGLAAVLSLLFTGAGHWYAGRVARGFAFFAAAFIAALLTLVLIGLVLLPIVYVWAAVDASKCATVYNQSLMAQAASQAPTINQLPR